MNLVSIITAVHRPAAPYLSDAYLSLLGQSMPDGWGWEWLIEQDGRDLWVPSCVPDDSRVEFRQNVRGGGAGVTRNMALGRATGVIVKTLDADDQLLPGTLHRDITALQDPTVGWATSAVLDLLPDGTTATWDMDDPAPGRIRAGDLYDFWAEHERPQVVPGTMTICRDLIDQLGGWMALPVSEDTGLLLAASQLVDGWFHSDYGLLYRKWPGQTTAEDHSDSLAARKAMISRRVAALASVS